MRMCIYLYETGLFEYDFFVGACPDSLKLQHILCQRPIIHSQSTLARACNHQTLDGTNQQGSDMAVEDGKLCHNVLALVLV